MPLLGRKSPPGGLCPVRKWRAALLGGGALAGPGVKAEDLGFPANPPSCVTALLLLVPKIQLEVAAQEGCQNHHATGERQRLHKYICIKIHTYRC